MGDSYRTEQEGFWAVNLGMRMLTAIVIPIVLHVG